MNDVIGEACHDGAFTGAETIHYRVLLSRRPPRRKEDTMRLLRTRHRRIVSILALPEGRALRH
jgi:hypothetical protein